MRGILVIVGATLAGCASSSGVYEVSPGVYTVTSTAITSFGGAATAKGNALKKAQARCAAEGKQMQLVDQKTDSQFTQGSADVTFRCVPKSGQ
jgi:hypothetical protein